MSTSWFYALLPAWWPGAPSGVGTASGSTLTGTAADDSLSTPFNTSNYTVLGLDGDDRLADSPGAYDRGAVLVGGAGDDVYVVSRLDTTITEDNDAGSDAVWYIYQEENISLTGEQRSIYLPDSIENLLLGSNALNLSRPANRVLDYGRWGFGNDLDNAMLGNDLGANYLEGRGGADRLQGLGGRDLLDGGDGVDVAYFSGDRADYVITNMDGALIVNDRDIYRDDVDRLKNIEILRFRDGDVAVSAIAAPLAQVVMLTGTDILRPSDGAEMFHDVASGDSIAIPRAQADALLTFSADGAVAAGHAGRDVIYLTEDRAGVHFEGMAGDDVYIVQWEPGSLSGADPRIVESADGGNDTVWIARSDYVLPDHVENMVTMTQGGVRMFGNDDHNKLIGGADDDQLYARLGDDILYGGGGDDVIVGGDGNDALFGGTGADTFAWEYDHVGDHDVIFDFHGYEGDILDFRAIAAQFDNAQFTVADANNAYSRSGYVEYAVYLDREGDGAADFHIVTILGYGVRQDIETAIAAGFALGG